MAKKKQSSTGKLGRLKKILVDMDSALVAYSGGVDSTLLLKVARDVLGDKAFAVIAKSPTYPAPEINAAVKMAGRLGSGFAVIETGELKNPKFSSNPVNRCYYCKRELFSMLKKIAGKRGLRYVLDGSNSDDRKDFRPGSKAKIELGVRSPLEEACLSKKDIRTISKKLNLPTWSKPSMACLASRFPYGTPLRQEDLKRVNAAEKFLHKLGFKQLRVRHYTIPSGSGRQGNAARIEFLPSEIKKALNKNIRDKIIGKFKALDYVYVTLDLEGYRTGSMNEILVKKRTNRR